MNQRAAGVCGLVQPGTLGHQRCVREGVHTHHRSQDGGEWSERMDCVPAGMIAAALEAHAETLDWEVCDGEGAYEVAADLRRIAAEIRGGGPTPQPGDRVTWLHTAEHRRAGIVAELDTNTTIAVMPDDDPMHLLYLDASQLTVTHPAPKGVAHHGIRT